MKRLYDPTGDSFPIPPPIGPGQGMSAEFKAAEARRALRCEKRRAYYLKHRDTLLAASKRSHAKKRALRTKHWCVLPKPATPLERVLPARGLSQPGPGNYLPGSPVDYTKHNTDHTDRYSAGYTR